MTGQETSETGGGAEPAPSSALFIELEQLCSYIRKVRGDLAAIGPSAMRDKHLKKAATQLDEVIQATENAANQIMDSCDVLQAVAQDIGGEPAQRINTAVTTIYEACGFQDLTGQRIVLVNNTLSYIEGKLDDLIERLGITADDRVDEAREETAAGDRNLLNGPALSKEANDQSAIDRLLSELG